MHDNESALMIPFRKLFQDPRRRRPRSAASVELPSELLWLLDAPLFIDARQVDAFYDAVLRPDYEGTSITLSDSITKETTIGGQTTVGAALPWFGKAEIGVNAARRRSREQGQSATLRPISNSYRHLLSVALHYAALPIPGRLVIATTARPAEDGAAGQTAVGDWLGDGFAEASPRALVFLDVLPGSKLLPAALELDDGKVHVLIDDLGQRLGDSPPTYPVASSDAAEINAYFQWFADHYSYQEALNIVEENVQGGKISWIDFNVSVAAGRPPFLHLHLVGRGEYETGVFGYYFITRGHQHGLRIVGTLKSGLDMNVLAVFER